jgi:N-acetylglucosamine kinase-like BadF-type ATPase
VDRVTPAAVLAVDGGNSKTDVALDAADGSVLASLRGPGASREHFGNAGAVARLGALVAEVAALAGLGGRRPFARHVSACLAGVDLPAEEAELAAAIAAEGWSATAAVANDTFAVLRAGLPAGQTWGVAVTCGAGINCVGVAPDGRVARYLSFGATSGDWGGGLDLGAAALWHAMRAEDGRGAPTVLLSGVSEFFGLPSVSEVAIAVRAGTFGRDELRRLTPVLFAAAGSGDPVATAVVERQAEEICVMALTAMRRLGLDSAPVVLGGGVLEARDPLLSAGIGRRLAAAGCGPGRVVDAPPVTGAALLGLDFLREEGLTAADALAAERRLRASRLRPAAAPPV